MLKKLLIAAVSAVIALNGAFAYAQTSTTSKDRIDITKSKQAGTLKQDTKYYTNSNGVKVQSPTRAFTVPVGATAQCKDGTYSFSQSRRGTCSGHKGVLKWL